MDILHVCGTAVTGKSTDLILEFQTVRRYAFYPVFQEGITFRPFSYRVTLPKGDMREHKDRRRHELLIVSNS